MKKPRRCRRLTAAERKKVWAAPESNAGAGWQTRQKPHDPRVYEVGHKVEK